MTSSDQILAGYSKNKKHFLVVPPHQEVSNCEDHVPQCPPEVVKLFSLQHYVESPQKKNMNILLATWIIDYLLHRLKKYLRRWTALWEPSGCISSVCISSSMLESSHLKRYWDNSAFVDCSIMNRKLSKHTMLKQSSMFV